MLNALTKFATNCIQVDEYKQLMDGLTTFISSFDWQNDYWTNGTNANSPMYLAEWSSFYKSTFEAELIVRIIYDWPTCSGYAIRKSNPLRSTNTYRMSVELKVSNPENKLYKKIMSDILMNAQSLNGFTNKCTYVMLKDSADFQTAKDLLNQLHKFLLSNVVEV